MRDSKNGPFFLPPGAEAFKRDNPNAEVHFYDKGHFGLATHAREMATAIRDFLGRKLTQTSAAYKTLTGTARGCGIGPILKLCWCS